LGVLACTSPPPQEEPDPGSLPPTVAQARDVVLEVQNTLLEVAKAGPDMGFEERRAKLMDVGLQSFDLPLMAQLSYGNTWASLTREQQKLWIDTFILFRSSAIAKINSRDRGQVYRFKGYEEISDQILLIRTGLRYPRRSLEITIDYRLVRVGGHWKIVDRYSPSSVSEVAMRRSEYRTLLQKEGFTGLIRDMERRIQGYAAQ